MTAAVILAFVCAAISAVAGFLVVSLVHFSETIRGQIAFLDATVGSAALVGLLVWGAVSAWRGNRRLLVFTPLAVLLVNVPVWLIAGFSPTALLDGLFHPVIAVPRLFFCVLLSVLLMTRSSKDYFASRRGTAH